MDQSQKENISKLMDLIQQYPDLPVVPFFDPCYFSDYDGVAPGSFGGSFMDEYLFMPEQYSFYLKSDNNIMRVMERYFENADFNKLLDEKADLEQIYNALPWRKAIFVNIEMPEL